MAKASVKKQPKDASESPVESVAGSTGELPAREEIDALLARINAFALDVRFSRIRAFFAHLAQHVPQVLLLEGGTLEERLDAAHFWALSLNCLSPAANAEGTTVPCLSCPACSRMVVHMHRDFFFLDGSAGNIKIDDVRAVKTCLGEPPREANWRIVLFREAQAMAAPAANALLKSLEEPQPSTSFVMLAPQRERLLPTLVSRSMVLTLPWPKSLEATDEVVKWTVALCRFMATGQGWFRITGVKGAVGASSVHTVANLVRRAMAVVLGNGTSSESQRRATAPSGIPGGRFDGEASELIAELAGELTRIPFERLRYLDEVLAEAQDSAIAGANPAVILDWLATRLYLLRPR